MMFMEPASPHSHINDVCELSDTHPFRTTSSIHPQPSILLVPCVHLNPDLPSSATLVHETTPRYWNLLI